MELELNQILRAIRRWWWLLLVVPVTMGFVARVLTMRETPTYMASADLYVDPSQGSGSTDYNVILGTQTLLDTYRELVRSPVVLTGVVQDLQLPYDIDTLKGQITAETLGSTLVLSISVTDTDAQRAADIANNVAQHFTEYLAQRTIQRNQDIRAAIDRQIAQTQQQINDLNVQIEELRASSDPVSPATQTEIDALQSSIDQLQRTYSDLLATSQSTNFNDAAAATRVSVLAGASRPEVPVAPNVRLNEILGALAGLLIAGGIVAMLQYVDNTVISASDFVALTGSPLLARIDKLRRLRSGPSQLFILSRPNTAAAEAIRLLRTTLQFSTTMRDLKSLGITSAHQDDGKSTVTANLAIAMANAGLETVVIDADLRKPAQHHIFATENAVGLTTLLMRPDVAWRDVAMPIPAVPKLMLITAGPQTPNPADLLSSERLPYLLAEIKNEVDCVLIDNTAILTVTDALVVAPSVDGVVVVTRAGRTRLDALQAVAYALRRTGSPIIGIILNQQRGRDKTGYHPLAEDSNRADMDDRTATVRLIESSDQKGRTPGGNWSRRPVHRLNG